ncbi:MAG: hypothetical protein HC800_14880 [Phormidesmis sp. RL_2_1]|nr:hypothetical protein [Phormidesmis sp. RL_2_1]
MKQALALLIFSTLVLAADLVEPGWGKFPNPVFYVKFAANVVVEKMSNADIDTVDPADARLAGCEGEAETTTITEAQAALSKTLAGKSSMVAVQALGTPACQLANGSYRWLIESGLALDARINEEGVIDDASLSR